MKHRRKIFFTILLVVLLGLVGTGFIFKDRLWNLYLNKVVARGVAGDIKIEDGGKKVTYKGDSGEFSYEGGGSLPTNFPKDFPIYPGAKLESSWTAKGENGDGVSAMWSTTAGPQTVADYYKTELVKSGWKTTSAYENTDSSNFSLEKNNIIGLVGITKSDGTTSISVSIGNN